MVRNTGSGDKQTVEALRNWNGTLGGLNTISFIRVTRDQLSIDVDEEMIS